MIDHSCTLTKFHILDLLTAEANSRSVGKNLALFIKYLGTIGLHYEMITLIGHSLGAQVSANCGEELQGYLGSIFGKV